MVDRGYNVPHQFIICVDFDGNDVRAGTSKGIGHGIGEGYYPRLRPAGSTPAQEKMEYPSYLSGIYCFMHKVPL